MFRHAKANAFETRVAEGNQVDVMDKVLYVVDEFNDDDMETESSRFLSTSNNYQGHPGIFICVYLSRCDLSIELG